MIQEFISEDDLDTFEGWLRCQAIDIATLTPGELEMWRGFFKENRERSLANPKVGLMKLRSVPGQYRYAVAVREGSDLWLAAWVNRSPKGDIFLFVPRGERGWDPHISYHSDGTLHSKSHGKVRHQQQRQPLTGTFRGTEQLPAYGGFGPKRVGAVCDPGAFAGVVEVGPGVLGPRDGTVVVDLVEPNCEPISMPSAHLVRQEIFHDTIPWIVVRVFS